MLVFSFALVGVAVSASSADAQTASATSKLAQGWTALAAGQPVQAAAAAEQILKTTPRNHDAVSLAIAAQVAAGRPLPALDSYERWLAASSHEDRFLLEPVAAGVLRELATNPAPRIKFGALQALARSGDPAARAALQQAAQSETLPIEAERALAETGDKNGVQRLEARIAAGGPRDKSGAIEALSAAGSRGSSTVIALALKDPALPSRIAAAEALASLGVTDAIPALKEALNDPEGPVRVSVAVALARLGDQSGAAILQTLESSPVGDLRLLLASARAPGNPEGAWVGTAAALLGDPDPLVRVGAAELLLGFAKDPGEARSTVEAALADSNPALRSAAASSLATATQRRGLGDDLRTLRRLLRDQIPDVRLAAGALLLNTSNPRSR